MFKAGKKLRIRGEIYNNRNAISVAPTIDLQGLVLSANKPMSKEAMDFLQSRDVIVQQIEEDGDRLVRLSGFFSLRQKEVKQFLEKNLAEVNSKQAAEAKVAKEFSDAANFQRQISTRVENLCRIHSYVAVGHMFF